MKKILLICVLMVTILVPGSGMQNNTNINAAVSCKSPTCFWIGDVLVSEYRTGNYFSRGLCLFTVEYYNHNGIFVYADNRYARTTKRTNGYVYISPYYALVRIIPLSISDYKKEYFNDCEKFIWQTY